MDRIISINRQSVCMGDDCEDHEIKIKINEVTTLKELTINLIKMRYLASVDGGKAVWVLKFHTQLLAVVAQEWNEPKYLVNADAKVYDLLNIHDKPELFFEYLMQVNPNIVYQKLKKCIGNNLVVNGK